MRAGFCVDNLWNDTGDMNIYVIYYVKLPKKKWTRKLVILFVFFLVISMLLFQPGNLQILIFWQLYWFLWGQIFKLVSNVHNDMNYIINNWKIKIVLSFENEGKLKRNLKFNIKKIGTGIFFIFYQTTEFFLKKMCAFSTTVETPT